MADFRSPFTDLRLVADDGVEVQLPQGGDDWHGLGSINHVPAAQYVALARGLTEITGDVGATLRDRISEISAMTAAPFDKRVLLVLQDPETGRSQRVAVDLRPKVIPNEAAKLAALTSAYTAILTMARANGMSEDEIATAWFLATEDQENGGGHGAGGGEEANPAAMMQAMMGGEGGGQQCQQQ